MIIELAIAFWPWTHPKRQKRKRLKEKMTEETVLSLKLKKSVQS
jgi:hypothetical protein